MPFLPCSSRAATSYVVFLSLLAISCSSFPRCKASSRSLSDVFYSDSDQSADFHDGLILFGYHESSIAPSEILTADPDTYMAVRLRLAERGCVSWDQLSKFPLGAYLVSGRGHYIKGEAAFTLDCICELRKVKESQELFRKMYPGG